jgi:hypothetical protein
MRRHHLFTTLLFLGVVLPACGGGDDSNTPDAPPRIDSPMTPDAPPSGVCGAPAGTISSYPGTFDGDTTNAGADFTVAAGACATEASFFDPIGNDQVVQLENLTPGQLYVVSVDSAVADLSFYVAEMCDAAGPTVGACLLFNDATVAGTAEINAFRAPASGRVAVIIDSYDAAELGVYTLTVTEGECATIYDCTTGAAPVCGASFTCEAGPNLCTGDDAGDTGATSDDGPGGAQVVTGPTQVITAAVCNEPATESDWYAVTVTDGQSVDLQLDFDAGTADLDVYVWNGTGVLTGLTFWQAPETVNLTYLPAGTYYFQIAAFAPSGPAATAYTATFTVGAAQTCATAADCAAEYTTQVYRGACLGSGACDFIPAGAGLNGAPCDTADDCTSGFCSYLLFESDAQDSVCSTMCTTQTDCDAVGPGLACTQGFGTNFCLPSCANDIECGVPSPGATNDPGEAWNYLTCIVADGACSPDP